MKCRVTKWVLSSLLLPGMGAAAGGPDYNREVRPVLSNACFKCHGPDVKGNKGDLRLDERAGALKGGKSKKPAVVPGKPEESEMMVRLLSHDPDEAMPPASANKVVTAAQRETIKAWIAAGAEYAPHWAFQKPVAAVAPGGAAGPGAIDAFVEVRRKAAGLAASPEAAAETLCRRLYLDLTGLPPTEAELDDFLKAEAAGHEAAVQALVDRLLASPHYGERWARKWLDLARYADTNGYEKDRARQIWPWRDWVIKSLNEDMPFDRFSVLQLAGDLVPDAGVEGRVATGFHRNTMVNEEGGIDPLEFRFHAVTDRVGTTGATWLGLTLQCAQCHTHKYDPILHTEYYSVMAFLDNADELDMELPDAKLDERRKKREAELAGRLAKLESLWPLPSTDVVWETPKPEIARLGVEEKTRILPDGSVDFSRPGPAKQTAVFSLVSTAAEVASLRLEALMDDGKGKKGPGRTPHGNFVLTGLTVEVEPAGGGARQKVELASATAGAEQGGFPVASLISGGQGWAVDVANGTLNSPKEAVFRFATPVKAGPGTKWTVTLAQEFGGHHTLGRPRISLGSAAPKNGPTAAQDMAAKESAWLAVQRASTVAWTTLPVVSAKSNMPKLTPRADGSVLAGGDITKDDRYEIQLTSPLEKITAIRLEALPDDSLPRRGPGMAWYEGPKGDFFLGELQATIGGNAVKFSRTSESYSANAFGGAAVTAAQAIDGDAQTGWACHDGQGRAHEAVFVLAEPVMVPKGTPVEIKMQFGRHYACSLGCFRLSVTDADGAKISASALGREAQADLLAGRPTPALHEAFLLQAPEMAAVKKEIDALRKPVEGQTTLVFQERPADNPRPTFLRRRGEFTQPEEEVKPGVLPWVSPLPADAPRNRLGFARWLVSQENPLTARVVVNRAWAAFFGRGIVRTTEDFGYQGDAPTHPELLDWLAVQFMKDGWSMKKLHRSIVLSATYRQASAFRPEAVKVDPGNLLLWRGPRVRLEAEQVRDAALTAAGQLSRKIGGPSVYPPQPAGVTTEGTYGGLSWPTSTGEDRFRRSIYTYAKRTAPFALYNTFDAPTGEACVPRRDVSDTPLQSLSLLNDVVFVEAGQALGKWLAAQPGDDAARLRAAWRRGVGRAPDAAESASLLAWLGAQRSRLTSAQLDPKAIAGPDATPETALWTLLARAMMNTDEFVTKE